jgi:tetratricopeptide (TPR) repeat protein
VPAPPRESVADAGVASATDSGDAPIVFIENDYARALAEAREHRVPLFIDAWAPWCHTCLSMQRFVFPDPALRRHSSRFVWLALDTEREENAPLVAKLGLQVLPTLYVIDPSSEEPIVAWRGSLTAVELSGLLDDAELAANRGDAGGEAAAALLRGRQASAEGRSNDAIAAYKSALSLAPTGWPRAALAADGLVTELEATHQLAPCIVIGADEARKMVPGSALADVARAVIRCGTTLPKGAPERARLPEVIALGERVANDPSQPILDDDRSDLYAHVVDGLRELGRTEDAKRVSRTWASLLEGFAGRAATPERRAVFDSHRLLAYLALGEPQRALPMLELSERDFPEDYNPPARLALAYLEMKRYDEASAAVKRALVRAYGPRKLRLWSLEADIDEAKGDRAAARSDLRDALAFARSQPLLGAYPKLRDALEARLAKMR